MQQLEPVTLVGELVRLEPLNRHHIDALVVAANEDRSTFDRSPVPQTHAEVSDYVDGLLASQQRGEVLPFAQVRVADDMAVGSTRYLEPRWWSGRALPDEIEIGGTWLAPSAQRTGINTEAKLLLLTHAFEVVDVRRVAIATDADNVRSRRAIERIGATYEGTLRNHRRTAHVVPPAPRQTAMYSIIDTEWPAARAALVAKLTCDFAGKVTEPR